MELLRGKIRISIIIKDILSKYSEAPAIKKIKEADKTYPKLMGCLQPFERDTLLKGYIDEGKINVTHIYLAQLLKMGFVDYVLTVNFDNLMLRALALYNEFPATYDMAILKDLTTTTFKEKSVVHLHGQHHGVWLLNTDEEMKKVEATVPRIFDTIKNKRPWIFIGYSGEDLIFEHIKKLGRFDNGLYWVTYKDNEPCKEVCDFLRTPNTNAHLIKGFDADSFMLKLNSELKLPQPDIIDKPFTTISNMLDNIVDIDDEEHYKVVKERLEISKEWVAEAKDHYEEGKTTTVIKNTLQIDLLKKEIINILISDTYLEKDIAKIELKALELENSEVNELLLSLYSNWGNSLGNLAKQKEGEEAEKLFKQSFSKYEKAIAIKEDYEVYYNWGNSLGNLAKQKEGEEAEKLFEQSFLKYEKAVAIKEDDHEVYYNWGHFIMELAKQKRGEESEKLLTQACDVLKLGVQHGGEYYNLACSYALTSNKIEALKYLGKSFSKNEITIDFVSEDEDWKNYKEDEGFKAIFNKYR